MISEKVKLGSLVGHSLDLQDTLRFSGHRAEELHYEGSSDPDVQALEIMIPIDQPISLLISPVSADQGTPDLASFLDVCVDLDHGIIIHPQVCHYVREAGRFMVLKTKGGWKFNRKTDLEDGGSCRFQKKCRVPTSHCPNPSEHFKKENA